MKPQAQSSKDGWPPVLRRASTRRLSVLALAVSVVGCGPDPATEVAVQATGGEPDRGPALIVHYGCGTCHTIPGVTGAHGRVGPELGDVGSRQYLAGMLPNTPPNMVRWIQDPQSINPKTVMPDMGVTDPQARDIAAYLYSRR